MCLCVSVLRRRPASVLVQPQRSDNKLSVLQQAHRLAVSEWKACHVLAWLEVDMNMTSYAQACFDNIKSGKVATHFADLYCISINQC